MVGPPALLVGPSALLVGPLLLVGSFTRGPSLSSHVFLVVGPPLLTKENPTCGSSSFVWIPVVHVNTHTSKLFGPICKL